MDIELVASFVVQTLSGVVAVFVGVFLALVVDRRQRERDVQSREDEQIREFERATDSILGSVVKNIAEAKRILGLLNHPKGSRLLYSGLESSVWNATQDQFIALCCSVDERVIFAQFFDNVRQLQAFVDFRSSLQVSATTGKLDRDEPALKALITDVDQHLSELAEDLRFCGVVLINDHGKPVHKRLIGIKAAVATAANPP